MEKLLWLARISGLVGVGLCVVAVIGRLAGAFVLGSFQTGTVLIVGMAATLIACLGYLVFLVEGRIK